MTKEQLVLASLAPAKGQAHTPVQVQKLFFLIDSNISDLVGGRHFDFKPYSYGPFDPGVYVVLETLAIRGRVSMVFVENLRHYLLTVDGQQEGERILGSIDPKASEYIRRVSEFVRSLSFTDLVSAIYKAYPDMRQNSVFQE